MLIVQSRLPLCTLVLSSFRVDVHHAKKLTQPPSFMSVTCLIRKYHRAPVIQLISKKDGAGFLSIGVESSVV